MLMINNRKYVEAYFASAQLLVCYVSVQKQCFVGDGVRDCMEPDLPTKFSLPLMTGRSDSSTFHFCCCNCRKRSADIL